MESAWRLLPPTLTGVLTSRLLAAPVPRRLSLFRYDAAYVGILSLPRKDCCCILQQNEQQCAPAAAVYWSTSGLSLHRSARHQVE